MKPGRPLGPRLWDYQKERFPVWFTLPLALGICLSAVAYSRLSSGRSGFIDGRHFILGFYTSAVLFFLLRVLDEHKDQALDRRYRPELPVPRGLVSLAELRAVIGVLGALALLLNAWLMPAMLPLLAVALLWATLMAKEFFAPRWLKAHPMAYLHSHMLFLPAMDFYSTGLDWRLEGRAPGLGLLLFLGVTYLNGLVVEFGRKLRAPGEEREGVETYSQLWGAPRAARIWMLSLLLSALAALAAGRQAQAGWPRLSLLGLALAAALWQGRAFLAAPGPAAAKRVETASGLWTLFTYFWLGLGPLLFA